MLNRQNNKEKTLKMLLDFLIFLYEHSGYTYIGFKIELQLARITKKIRQRQKIAADNFILSGIFGGNCLLPAIIARATLSTRPLKFYR